MIFSKDYAVSGDCLAQIAVFSQQICRSLNPVFYIFVLTFDAMNQTIQKSTFHYLFVAFQPN